MTNKGVSRRAIIRGFPGFAMIAALGGLGALGTACTEDLYPTKRPVTRTPSLRPTDDDEYVPQSGELTPVNAGDQPPAVPIASWEARARQLESEQERVYGRGVFTSDAATNGPMAGKERSHVPEAVLSVDFYIRHVTVLVQHVMGKNGLPDAGSDAAKSMDAAPEGGDASVAADGGIGADASGGADASLVVDASVAPDAGVGRPLQEHYVTTIYLRADIDGVPTVVGLWEFASTDPAPVAVKFTLPAGVTSVVAYEWCTLHGLWKSDALTT